MQHILDSEAAYPQNECFLLLLGPCKRAASCILGLSTRVPRRGYPEVRKNPGPLPMSENSSLPLVYLRIPRAELRSITEKHSQVATREMAEWQMHQGSSPDITF